MNTILCIAFAAIGLFILYKLWKTHKEPKINDVALITGGVKCGKSSMSFYLAYRKYCSNLRKWRFISFFQYKFSKQNYAEMPLFYSSIPLTIDYVPVTRDLLLRKVRPAFKSVCFIDEASLVADSFDFKDDVVNEEIKLFNKLWGHMTHGGTLVYNTQNEQDLHYNIKRCVASYIWVHHCIKWIPFLLIFKCREMYATSPGVANVFNEDVEDTLKWVWCSKSIWKKFDCYCFSGYTDSKASVVYTEKRCRGDLKGTIVSFKKSTVLEETETDEKNMAVVQKSCVKVSKR